MAVNIRLSFIAMGMLLLMFCITDTECNVLGNRHELFSNLSDGEHVTQIYRSPVTGPNVIATRTKNFTWDNIIGDKPQSYPYYLRQALMDAGHVIENVIRKGKIRLTELPHEGWLL